LRRGLGRGGGFQDAIDTSTPHPNPLPEGEGTKQKLADGALNARLPRHFAHGRNKGKARGVGFLREGGDQDPPSLKPPLEVLETFGGAKVSDKRPAINGMRKPSTNSKGN
jgi:hypothetical protein